MPLRDDNGPLADRWTRPEEGAGLSGPVLLPLSRIAEAEAAGIDPSDLGVHVENDVDTAALGPLFGRIALISVAFPSFADGRGFSIARRLRDMGFKGRLRATGAVIADQFAYLMACGFDEVDAPEQVFARQPEAQWQKADQQMSLTYQRGHAHRTGLRNILDARRAARAWRV